MNPMLELSSTVLEHANRGVRLQLLLRGALVVFLALTLVLVPPTQSRTAYYVIVAAYGVGAVIFGRWAWTSGPAVARWAWLGLFVDVAVVATLTLLAGKEASANWASDVLAVGFFLLPVLAATQLRPGICAAVVVPTVLVYLLASWATQAANGEPHESIAMRTFMLASVGIAAIGLSRIQGSRVRAIGQLVADRTRLLDDLVHVEQRERQVLSERLHDGALQYVLAARHDLEDARDGDHPGAVDRIDHALAESSRMLRSTVSELHPAVLDRVGLAQAVRDLVAGSRRRDLDIDVDVDAWPDGVHTAVDDLLFSAARELLSNVVRHAGATQATVALRLDSTTATLVVTDDGTGIADGDRERSLAGGHIGLHSQALRIEAAGGTLRVEPGRPGTMATVVVPVGGDGATSPAASP
jgi:two-component system, NarL family, sensor kinase